MTKLLCNFTKYKISCDSFEKETTNEISLSLGWHKKRNLILVDGLWEQMCSLKKVGISTISS